MRAAVFHKPGDIRVDNVPDPQILDARDIILRVTSTAICGSELHILSGTVPQKDPMVMGHEFMGTVSIMGVYGSPYDNFPLLRIFDKGITIKQGQAPVLNDIDQLIGLATEEKVVLDDIISHSLPLIEATHAYKIFDEKQEDCVKVVLKP